MKYFLLLFALLSLFACNYSSDNCTIEGKVYGSYEGKTVYLCTSSRSIQDSCVIHKGTFSFTLPADNEVSVKLLLLRQESNDIFPIILPIVTEHGKVGVYLGEKVLTTGTPLNEMMQDFLLATDAFSEGVSQKEETMEEMKARFANLLKEYIMKNKENVIGEHIYRTYAKQLTPEQRTTIVSSAGEEFASRIKK